MNLFKLTLYKHVLNCLNPKLNKIQKFLITKTVICIIIHVWAQLDHAKYALQPSDRLPFFVPTPASFSL